MSNNDPITKHDLFAAAALCGLLAGRNHAAPPYTLEEVTTQAIRCADAMLQSAERVKNEIK